MGTFFLVFSFQSFKKGSFALVVRPLPPLLMVGPLVEKLFLLLPAAICRLFFTTTYITKFWVNLPHVVFKGAKVAKVVRNPMRAFCLGGGKVVTTQFAGPAPRGVNLKH